MQGFVQCQSPRRRDGRSTGESKRGWSLRLRSLICVCGLLLPGFARFALLKFAHPRSPPRLHVRSLALLSRRRTAPIDSLVLFLGGRAPRTCPPQPVRRDPKRSHSGSQSRPNRPDRDGVGRTWATFGRAPRGQCVLVDAWREFGGQRDLAGLQPELTQFGQFRPMSGRCWSKLVDFGPRVWFSGFQTYGQSRGVAQGGIILQKMLSMGAAAGKPEA